MIIDFVPCSFIRCVRFDLVHKQHQEKLFRFPFIYLVLHPNCPKKASNWNLRLKCNERNTHSKHTNEIHWFYFLARNLRIFHQRINWNETFTNVHSSHELLLPLCLPEEHLQYTDSHFVRSPLFISFVVWTDKISTVSVAVMHPIWSCLALKTVFSLHFRRKCRVIHAHI